MFGRLNRQVRKAGGGGAKLRLQPLEAREVPALNFWIGTSDNYANATFWTDGIPTADDIVILNGIPTPTTPTTQADGETPPAPQRDEFVQMDRRAGERHEQRSYVPVSW